MWGALYDLALRPFEAGGLQNVRRRIVSRAHGRVLEVGVGTGLNLPHYPPGTVVTGIDPDRPTSTGSCSGSRPLRRKEDELMFEDTRAQERRAYWENVYRTKEETEVSWHQEEPALSLDLIRDSATRGSRILDVGGGSSILAGRLVALGFEHVAVLDISEAALERAKARTGPDADKVRWIGADVTAAADLGRVDVWHDRAVFHFLTTPEEREKYVALAGRSVPAGGRLIIGTFALDGPEKCSGLTIERYDAQKLAGEFAPAFSLLKETRETHVTPWGTPQQFTYAVFERYGTNPPSPAI